MSGIEGLRVVTLDNVPINVVLENIPKPIRITGFDMSNKTQNITTTTTTNTTKKSTPTIFTFSPSSIQKYKVE